VKIKADIDKFTDLKIHMMENKLAKKMVSIKFSYSRKMIARFAKHLFNAY